jgi:hypothetical protein
MYSQLGRVVAPYGPRLSATCTGPRLGPWLRVRRVRAAARARATASRMAVVASLEEMEKEAKAGREAW